MPQRLHLTDGTLSLLTNCRLCDDVQLRHALLYDKRNKTGVSKVHVALHGRRDSRLYHLHSAVEIKSVEPNVRLRLRAKSELLRHVLQDFHNAMNKDILSVNSSVDGHEDPRLEKREQTTGHWNLNRVESGRMLYAPY